MLTPHFTLKSAGSLLFLFICFIGVQSFVFGDPCYTWSEAVGCWSQGGAKCDIIKPLDVLPCPGGPWTIADLASINGDVNWPCDYYSVQHLTPKDNATVGNASSGYMELGDFNWVCSSEQDCEKKVTWILPIIVACNALPLEPCKVINLFSAGGDVCPHQ